MIVDFERFVRAEDPYWHELERLLDDLDQVVDRLDPSVARRLTIAEAERFHYLYQRACSDLAQLGGLPLEPRVRQYLEPLVARAYAEIHETRGHAHRFHPLTWFFVTFPRTFRRHSRALGLAVATTLLGCALGVFFMQTEEAARNKRLLLPFGHGEMSPSERVEYEEQGGEPRRESGHTAFSAMLMTHNTKVSIGTMALGMTWGIGTILMLFANGVIMGMIVCDYIADGQSVFLAGWLLPHGSVEIPSIVIAGQAGLVLAGALIGWRSSIGIRSRLRIVAGDVATLIFGVAILLVWAGIVESFLSQYHEPVLPYWLKIAFGATQLVLLVLFLALSGRNAGTKENGATHA